MVAIMESASGIKNRIVCQNASIQPKVKLMKLTDNVPILMVDDQVENLRALEAVLDSPGLTLVRAQSGHEALQLVLRHDFALVLLDVQMPVMDGFEVAESLRLNPRTRHIPIIFVTAGMNDLNLQFRGYQLGAVDYLIRVQPEFDTSQKPY